MLLILVESNQKKDIATRISFSLCDSQKFFGATKTSPEICDSFRLKSDTAKFNVCLGPKVSA